MLVALTTLLACSQVVAQELIDSDIWEAPSPSAGMSLGPPSGLAPEPSSPQAAYPAVTESPPLYVFDQPPLELTPNWLNLDVRLSEALLDFQNRQTDKEIFILHDQLRRGGARPQIVVGGQTRFSFLAAVTNTDDKFSYLGRFPTDFSGGSATDARILQANAHATAHVTPYASVYGELLFSDVFSFRDFKQGSLQVRQAYGVFGNLQVNPFYFTIGKKNLNFGDLSTLSPFTQSVVWHYFAVLAEGVTGGYHGRNWDFTLSGINGGRGIRVADSPEKGKMNNFAANVTYHV